ncbi:MAG TPA: PA14 domain-containing protein [Clostridia bacterium]|nr:PA14 domain-containing protein [Clostridia bacterium]
MIGIRRSKKLFRIIAFVLIVELCFGTVGMPQNYVFADNSTQTPENDPLPEEESNSIEINSDITDDITVTESIYEEVVPKEGETDGTGNGLMGEYYDDIDFEDLVFTRVDPEIDFNWGFKAPDPSMDNTSFSVRWTGQVEAEYTGKYTFYAYASNGVRLWVNGKRIIDEWRFLFPKEGKGTIELTAGEKYDIKVEYQEMIGRAKAVLSWSCKEQNKQLIPRERLYCLPKAPDGITAVPSITSVALKWNEAAGAESYDISINDEVISKVNAAEYEIEGLTPDTEYTIKIRSVSSFGTGEWSKAIAVATLEDQEAIVGNGNGLKGEYYDNIIFKKLIFERVDQQIDFDWGKGTPDPKIKKNTTFSVKWTGKLLPQYTGKYTIYLYSDDGAKLWINGKELIDYWKPHSSKEGTAVVDLVAGEKCDIKIEYFNIMGDAEVKLYWSNPYEEKTIIPREQLFTTPGITENLQAAAEGSSITVTWDNTPGAEAYELEANGTTINIGMEARYEHENLIPNSQHTYRVRAVNEVGKGGWSGLVTRTSAPGVPTNIAMEETDTTITIAWDAVEAAEAYELEKDGEITDNGSGTSYTHSGLVPNTEHKYRIRSVNSNGKGEWSQIHSKYTLPDTPENYTIEVTSNTVTVSWDAVPGVLSYEIEADGEARNIGLETTYIHRGLRPNTEHTYRIRTIGYGGAGYWSEEIKASTMLAVPQNITAEATSSTITLTWDSVEYAQYYDIEADGAIVDNGGSTTFTHSGLAANIEHTYRVRAREDLGAGDWSEPLTKKTLLSTPSNFYAEATDTSVTIKWDTVDGADSYEVELTGVRTVKVSGPECVLDGLNPNTRYTYRVMAGCECNESEWSGEQSIITVLEAPSNITFESSSTITEIKWDTVNSADRYEIEVDGIVLDNGINTSYTHSGLEPDSRHEYRVRAINSNGTGVWSRLLLKTTSPHIPVNLAAMSTSRTNTLSWAVIDEAEGYEVEADGEIVASTSDTAFVHENIDPDSEHSYRVRAVNSNGKGDWSLSLSKTTAPHVPAGINAFSNSTEIRFVWEEVYEANIYEIEIDNEFLTDITETVYVYSELAPNSGHKFRIRAVNGNGAGDWSELVYKFTAPDVPVNLQAVSASGSIMISWAAVEAAEGYDIEINGTAVDVGNSTFYTHTGLNSNTQRAYKVRAKNENGIGDWSKVIAKTTLPGIPSNVTAEAAETAITLKWDTVAGADQYDIMVNSSVIESTMVMEYVYDGLLPDTEYAFNIRAKNSEGAGDWSETITKATMFGAPKGLTALASETSITLTWQPVSEDTAYDVEVDGIIFDNGTGTSFIHRDLTANTRHTYRVRAKTEASISSWSEALDIYSLPVTPANIIATASSSDINITWDMVEGAAGYELEADGTIIELGLINSYRHMNLAPDSTHVYRVRAIAEGGRSAWSNEISATTLLGAPLNIVTMVTDSSTTLTWEAVYGAAAYEVEADGIVAPVLDGTSYTHSALNANSVHFYRIRARNGEAEGEWSLPVTALTMLKTPVNIKPVPAVNAITLTWDAIGDAVSYEVEVNGTVISDIKEAKYQIVGLTANIEYIIRVKAKSEMNASDWSTYINQFTTPNIPINLKSVSTTGSITLSWDAVEGAVGYDVEADGSIIDNGEQITYINTELTPNTQHTYRVRAKNASAASEWSIPLTETTAPEMTINCAADESFNFVLAIPKKADISQRTITVTYNADELEVLDIYAATPGADLKEGRIQGTDITVMHFTPGKIVLTAENVTKTTMNVIKFMAKTNLSSNISYVIE